jgi:hypothetical protein
MLIPFAVHVLWAIWASETGKIGAFPADHERYRGQTWAWIPALC